MHLEEAIFSSTLSKAAHSSADERKLIVYESLSATYFLVDAQSMHTVVKLGAAVHDRLRNSAQWEPAEKAHEAWIKRFAPPVTRLHTYDIFSRESREDIVKRLTLAQQHLTQEKDNRPTALLTAAMNEIQFVIRAVSGAPVFSKRPTDKDFEPRSGVETTGTYGGRCVR